MFDSLMKYRIHLVSIFYSEHESILASLEVNRFGANF